MPYLYIFPAFIPLIVFTYLPLGRTMELSLFDWNLVQPVRRFVGTENYETAFASDGFWNAGVNTLAYIGALLLLDVVAVLMVAMMVWFVRGRAQSAYRSAIFLPTVLSMAIASVLWLWLLNPVSGLVNILLDQFGIQGANWFKDPTTVLWAVAFVAGWKYFGFNFVIALAGLASIPRDLIEAARIDGAGGVTLARRIILPLMGPTILFLIVTTIGLTADIVFVPILILSQGGPSGASDSLFYLIYEFGFKFFNIGHASAVAVVVFFVFAGFLFVQLRLSERYTHYE